MASGDIAGRADRARDPKSFLPLTPAAAYILLALADRDLHGYAIMKRIQLDSEGAVNVGPGTLYRTIKQLRSDGLIVEAGEARPEAEYLDDERRIYYRLTGFGRRVFDAEVKRVEELAFTAKARRLRAATANGR